MRQTMHEAYTIKYGYGDVVKSFDALEDAVDFINMGMKNKDSEHFVLFRDGQEMIWLDHYRDRNFSDVGYTVSRHNDKSIEFDKAKGGLVIKQPEGPKDDKLTRDILVSAIFKKKAYSVAQALNKFKFIIDNNKPTQIDFDNNTVYYNEQGDYTDHAADTLISQYKTKTEALADDWYKESVDDVLVEDTRDDVIFEKDNGEYLIRNTVGNYVAFNKYNVYIGGIKADSNEEAIAEFTKAAPKYESLEEDALEELFGFGKKKEKKNLYLMAMGRDSSGRLATGDIWREIIHILRSHLDNSSIKSNSTRNYFSFRVIDQCEFTATEKEFRRIKSDVDFFVGQLNRKPRYFEGPDTIDGRGVDNPDIKRSAENLIRFECIKSDIKESIEETADNWHTQEW
jgi:hypothetical protein